MRKKYKQMVCTAAAAVFMSSTCLAANPDIAYKEAVQTMAVHPEGEYVILLNLKMPITSMAISDTIDLQEKPFKVKSVVTMSSFNKTNSHFATVYVEQDGDHLNVYSGCNQKDKTLWNKQVHPLKNKAPLSDTFGTERSIMSGVKAVDIVGLNQYKVVFDARRIYNDTDKANWEKEGLSSQQAEIAAQALQALQKAGDISFVVTIDPKTKRIIHVEGLLTDQVQAVANAVASRFNGSEKAKALVGELIGQSSMTITIDSKPLPDGISIAVPKMVRTAATGN
ncbi:hypothetical protein NXG27_06565 [Megasphaera paucivorans]|uniref:Uncharacterized protein n=1 Tax=Megasphaera paucivorans TaxID=349095 RepID=A0A1G9V472_9FIRM|nr:hypothetical protein [Megasphaera paucivorans]SDM66994.1 hypothetical protein SAMN05660299_01325 [Megasphaera paucivorans]